MKKVAISILTAVNACALGVGVDLDLPETRANLLAAKQKHNDAQSIAQERQSASQSHFAEHASAQKDEKLGWMLDAEYSRGKNSEEILDTNAKNAQQIAEKSTSLDLASNSAKSASANGLNLDNVMVSKNTKHAGVLVAAAVPAAQATTAQAETTTTTAAEVAEAAAAEAQKPSKLPAAAQQKAAAQPERKKHKNGYDKALLADLDAIAQMLSAGDNQGALALAKSACARRCDALALNFALIRTALAANDLDTALAASDRVLIYDPQNIAAHLAAAQVYALSDNQTMLQMELEELKARDDLTPDQLAIVQRLQNSGRHQAYGSVAFGAGYESNARHQSTRDFYYQTPIGKLFIDGESPESAGYYSVQATLGVRSALGKNTRNDLSASSYNKYFFKPRKAGFSNLSVISLSDYLSHQIGSLSLGFFGGYDYAIVKTKPFSHTFSAMLSADWSLKDGWGLGAGLSASATSFAQVEDKSDRSNHLEFYLQGSKFAGKHYAYTRASVGRERAPHSEDLSAEYDLVSFLAGYMYQASEKWTLKSSLNAQHNRYKHFHSGFGNSRSDWLYRAEVGAQYDFSASTSINAAANYTRQNSNQELYGYDNFASYFNLKFKF